MATKQVVTKVWIDPGCIVCDACETTCPEVFEVLEETCVIRPAAMNAEFTKPLTDTIIEAAQECPVDVIKYETIEAEVAEGAPAPAPAAAPATAAAAEAPAPAAKPAPKAPKAEPVTAAAAAAAAPVAAAASAHASVAGGKDPSIEALLRAATSRGGMAGIMRASEAVPDSARDLKSKDPRELPPDARQARILEEARKQRETDPQRRAVVGGAALAIGWTAFGVATGVSVGPAFARFMAPNVLEEPDPRVRCGKFSKYAEMQPGEVNEDYKPQGIWIIRTEGRVAALSIICTHLGCIPNWLPNDRKFKCPCHGSGYMPNGINFEGPTPRPLERFKVTIEDGILVVDKSKKFQYELGQWDMPGSYIEV